MGEDESEVEQGREGTYDAMTAEGPPGLEAYKCFGVLAMYPVSIPACRYNELIN